MGDKGVMKIILFEIGELPWTKFTENCFLSL